jgi:hypothetical protein
MWHFILCREHNNRHRPAVGCTGTRVTRLCEFSPVGRVFTLGSFLKITEVAQILGQLFYTWQNVCSNFDKNVLGHIFGDFFTNSSGHPDWHLKYFLTRPFQYKLAFYKV